MKLKSLFFAFILTFSTVNLTNNLQAQSPSTSLESNRPWDKLNFTQLEQYLTAKNWRKANDETRKLILQATGRDSIGWIPPADFEKISCENLKTIDQLWVEKSNGRFGFSIQFPIYLETGNRPGKLVSDDAYNRFGDRLGWRNNNDWIIFIENLNYTEDAPIGHLPIPRSEYSITGGRLLYSVLAKRMIECNLVKN